MNIKIKNYSLPSVDLKEVARYMQSPVLTEEIKSLISSCDEESRAVLTPSVVLSKFPLVIRDDGTLDLGFTVTDSRSLSKRLEGCTDIVLFAATVGLGMDRLIRKYSKISPSRALCLQGLGAERVEALCTLVCEDIEKEYSALGLLPKARFSPGYADLPLSLQKDIFSVLPCSRAIGLTLNESLLMSPTKSVTAIVGLQPK